MNPDQLAEQVSELRWLVSELGNETEALTTTAYPYSHRFLMQNLTRRITQVAQRTSECLTQSVLAPVAHHEVQPIEQSA